MTPRVSVIAPVLNGEDYLRGCIESVRAQTIPDWEMIVVDDGSRDSSLSIAREYEQADQRIRVLQHENRKNRGVSFSRELGVANSCGEFIAFLDADDVFEPTKLERQIAAFADQPDCVLCHTAVRTVSVQRDRMAERIERNFNSRGTTVTYNKLDDTDAFSSNGMCTSSTMVRRSAFDGVRFAAPQHFQYEDWLLWILLASKGDFLFIPERLTRYRVHPDSATSRVAENDLVGIYSGIELLLTCLALSDDEQVRERSHRELLAVLGRAVALYRGEPSERDSPPDGVGWERTVLDEYGQQRVTQLSQRVRRAESRLDGYLADLPPWSMSWKIAKRIHRFLRIRPVS